MRVLIYAPAAVSSHHFETDLEIAENHIQAGDEVHIIRCAGELKKIGYMGCRGAFRCSVCKSRGRQGLGLLTKSEKLNVIPLPQLTLKAIDGSTRLQSISEVMQFKYKGLDIGSSYMSTLISELRDPEPDMTARENETRFQLGLLCDLADRFSEILEKVRPDRVYLFNGRFCIYRPLLRLCQQRKIDFFTHERGADNSRYVLVKNAFPHEIDVRELEMREAWLNPNVKDEEKKRLALAWYEARMHGLATSWMSYTDQQSDEARPQGWTSDNRNFAIYVSSEDEFVCVPGWELDLFKSQADAVDKICEHFSDKPNMHFFVRMHPNMRGLRNPAVDQFYDLGKKHSNCHVIAPEDPVSSYWLMAAAEKTISFGSTVGVETTVAGRPSILIGKSFYMNLGAAYRPVDREQLYSLIDQLNLPAKEKDGALVYGYWSKSIGIPFRYYRAFNFTNGEFKGVFVSGNRFWLALNYLAILARDMIKIAKGEYSFWHLWNKIKFRLEHLMRKAQPGN